MLTPGTHLRESYEVERLLGEGAFAEVYRVRHRFLGRQAMKVFKRGGMTPGEVEEMLGKAILLSRLGHPNVVRVFDANVFETPAGLRGFFTMELVSGGSLGRFWQSHGQRFIPVEMAVGVMRQVCRGLAVAHGETPPIIHRDIKPANILVGYEADGLRARLSDFGLAKRVNPLTLLASAAGTLAFKPPEAFGAEGRDSPAADVWAVGATLYLLLTDRLPFEIDPYAGWSARDVWSAEPPRPSEINFDVDAGLDELVMRCLAREPERRFEDARALLAQLETWAPKPTKRADAAQVSSAGKSQLGPASSPDWKRGEDSAQ